MLSPRDPKALEARRFDAVIVGGGVYGIMLLLEAVNRGLKPLLVERGDFAAETSHNSLRIIHGGFRYLQSLDLRRFRESVAERHWFLQTFPEYVKPLECLMPLYGEGIRRPAVLRAALLLNDVLSWRRNRGVRPDRVLPGGRVLSAAETERVFPSVDNRGLAGSAEWTDAFAPDMPRLLIEILRQACSRGASALNYVEATAMRMESGRVSGIAARERTEEGREFSFSAPVVINAAGPWSQQFARRCGNGAPSLFEPCLTWNAVFDHPPVSNHGIAVQPRRRGARAYFLVPWKGVLFAGTGQAPWCSDQGSACVSPTLMREFIADLNEAVPGLALREDQVARVYAGLQPAAEPGSDTPASRKVVIDHSAAGGPSGLFSVSGVKLTTARKVADTVLKRAFPDKAAPPFRRSAAGPAVAPHPDYPFAWMPAETAREWRAPLEAAAREESVVHLSDLILRRSAIGDNPERALNVAGAAAALLGYGDVEANREIGMLRREVAQMPGRGLLPHADGRVEPEPAP